MFKKPQIYLIATVLFLIITFFSVLIFSGGKNTTEQSPIKIPVFSPAPSSKSKPLEIKPILTKNVPFKPGAEGGGVNLDSSTVQQSQVEVAKILPVLPYESRLVAPSGKTISILIPGAQFQTTPWVLDVQIFDIDYQVTEGAEDYDLQKNSFIFAVSNVFEWMRTQSINPQKIIISWGDKSYIRESAEKWLSE